MAAVNPSEGEYRLAGIAWDNQPPPSGKLVELCAGQLGWKKATTCTMPKKLVNQKVPKNGNAAPGRSAPPAPWFFVQNHHWIFSPARAILWRKDRSPSDPA